MSLHYFERTLRHILKHEDKENIVEQYKILINKYNYDNNDAFEIDKKIILTAITYLCREFTVLKLDSEIIVELLEITFRRTKLYREIVVIFLDQIYCNIGCDVYIVSYFCSKLSIVIKMYLDVVDNYTALLIIKRLFGIAAHCLPISENVITNSHRLASLSHILTVLSKFTSYEYSRQLNYVCLFFGVVESSKNTEAMKIIRTVYLGID